MASAGYPPSAFECINVSVLQRNVHDGATCVYCRKNHQRALESVQASLEAETRAKTEALRSKKKLEQDINELEMAADDANRGRAECEKLVKKIQQQLADTQREVMVLAVFACLLVSRTFDRAVSPEPPLLPGAI